MAATHGQSTDGGIGELLPAQRGMAVGLMGTHGQRGIEQQHTLARPPLQVAALRHRGAQVLLYLLEDILQRGRKGHTVLYREAQPVGLARLVVRVLPENDHLHLLKRTEVEGIEDEPPRRIACRRGVLLPDGCRQLLEIRLAELTAQLLFPCRFYLYIHFSCKVTTFLPISALLSSFFCRERANFTECFVTLWPNRKHRPR